MLRHSFTPLVLLMLLVGVGPSSVPHGVQEESGVEGLRGDAVSGERGSGLGRVKRAQQQISPQESKDIRNVEVVVPGKDPVSLPPTLLFPSTPPRPILDLLTPPTPPTQTPKEEDVYNLGEEPRPPYDVEDESCPECHHVLNENHDRVHPDHRTSRTDHYLRNCTTDEHCVFTDFLRCNQTQESVHGFCLCLPEMIRAPIRAGKFKGTTWCLVMDRHTCTVRDTRDEDCVSGKCEKNGICARSINGTAPRGPRIQTTLLLLPLLRLHAV